MVIPLFPQGFAGIHSKNEHRFPMKDVGIDTLFPRILKVKPFSLSAPDSQGFSFLLFERGFVLKKTKSPGGVEVRCGL